MQRIACSRLSSWCGMCWCSALRQPTTARRPRLSSHCWLETTTRSVPFSNWQHAQWRSTDAGWYRQRSPWRACPAGKTSTRRRRRWWLPPASVCCAAFQTSSDCWRRFSATTTAEFDRSTTRRTASLSSSHSRSFRSLMWSVHTR